MHILSLCMFYILCLYKKGEKDFESLSKTGEVFEEKNFLFMHVSLTLFMHIYICLILCIFYILCLYKKGEKDFESLYKKGEKVLGEKNFWFMHVSLTLFCIFICLVLCTSLNIYLFIVMHELRGSFYEAYL